MAHAEPAKMREKIIENIAEVPAMPTSAAKVIRLIQDPDADMTQMADAIEFDPGLTTNVLRWANSAYFGGGYEIRSLRDAIVRLGMKRMFQLVMTSIAAPLVGESVNGYDLPAGSLLEEAIAVAIGTQELAATLGIKAPDHAFTAGLLHNIGKVVLGTFVDVAAEPIMELAYQEKVPFDEAERRILGIDHAEVGAILLAEWKIPQAIVDVVRWHHEPAGFTGDPMVLDLVHVALALSLQNGLGAGVDGLNYRPDDAVVSRLRLKPLVAESVACRMLAGLADVREAMGAYGAAGGAG